MTSSRFLVPVGLGVMAAAANYMLLQQATATTELVALRADLKPGEVITAAHLRAVPVRGDRPLFRGAVPFAERGGVEGMRVRRKVGAGELLLRADVESLESQIDYSLVPDGHTTLTLPARRGVVATRPPPGKYVELYGRRAGATRDAPPTQRFGPFRLVGWAAVTDPAGKETDVIQIVVAVPQARDGQVDELRNQYVGGSPDWLAAIEVAQPFAVEASGASGAASADR